MRLGIYPDRAPDSEGATRANRYGTRRDSEPSDPFITHRDRLIAELKAMHDSVDVEVDVTITIRSKRLDGSATR